MNRFLALTIALTIAAPTVFGLHSAAGLAQTPEVEPSPPAPEAGEEAEPTAPEETQPAEPEEPVLPEGYQGVTGEDWSFAVPSDWQNLLSDAVDLGEDARLLAQLSDGQKQTVVNLVAQSYKEDNNDYIEQSLKTLRDLGFTINAQQPVTLSGWQGVDLDVSLSSAQPPTHLLQRLIAANGTGYALTCGGKAENFAAVQATCQAILNSFQVKPE